MPQPTEHDLLRKAELFNEIANLVQSAHIAEDKTLSSDSSLREDSTLTHRYPPTFIIVGQRLVCNGGSVDLSRRPLVLQLFRLFLENGLRPLTKDEIIIGLYGHMDPVSFTRRYKESVLNNVVKLISRARVILASNFSYPGSELDWLVYDHLKRIWYLYRRRRF